MVPASYGNLSRQSRGRRTLRRPVVWIPSTRRGRRLLPRASLRYTPARFTAGLGLALLLLVREAEDDMSDPGTVSVVHAHKVAAEADLIPDHRYVAQLAEHEAADGFKVWRFEACFQRPARTAVPCSHRKVTDFLERRLSLRKQYSTRTCKKEARRHRLGTLV